MLVFLSSLLGLLHTRFSIVIPILVRVPGLSARICWYRINKLNASRELTLEDVLFTFCFHTTFLLSENLVWAAFLLPCPRGPRPPRDLQFPC